MSVDKIAYTADTEEPNCMRCDHCCDDFDCFNRCGSENYWFGYRRTEYIKDNNDEVLGNE